MTVTLVWVISLALAGYLAVGAYLVVMEGRLVFHPERVLTATPAQRGMIFEDVHLKADDGERLHGWFVPQSSAELTVLFFHGNAGNLTHCLDTFAILHRMGANVFAIDYRGYGQSSGSPSEAGTYLDAKAAWQYLTSERRIDPAKIVIFGRSLGGGVATWLATQIRPAGIVLESTFSSMPDVAQRLYPYVPVRWLARNRYDNLARINDIRVPILFIHSSEDELIPLTHSERLHEHYRGPKALQVIKGSHADGYIMSGELYISALSQFFLARTNNG